VNAREEWRGGEKEVERGRKREREREEVKEGGRMRERWKGRGGERGCDLCVSEKPKNAPKMVDIQYMGWL
jgi:hypothetical protein